MARLFAVLENDEFDLGILIPNNGSFELNRHVNVNKMRQGRPEFHIRVRKETPELAYTVVCPEEPFGYLSRLENAFMVRKNGKTMLGFRDEK
jgi:nicotinamide riboside kinase